MLEIVKPESNSVINLEDAYVLVDSINEKFLNKRVSSANRWEKVRGFMEKNPQLLLELMPGTPKKSEIDDTRNFI